MEFEATLYEILEVSPQASAQVIRAVYRCPAEYHQPDKNSGSEVVIECPAQINFTYGVLTDPRKRRRYDQRIGAQQASDVERRGKDQGDTCTREGHG